MVGHTGGAPQRRLTRRGWSVLLLAGLAVLTATVVGVRGLLATPVQGTDASGITRLRGEWEPYSCVPQLCQGYIQAGGASVFVVLPSGCSPPRRAAVVDIRGRLDRSLGRASYRALACPT